MLELDPRGWVGPYVKKPGYGSQRGRLGAALGGALRMPSLVVAVWWGPRAERD